MTIKHTFRSDRSISLFIHWIQRNTVNFPAGDLIPILMYHSIQSMPEEKCHPYFSTVTTPETFKSQMLWLKNEGYSIARLKDIDRHLTTQIKNKVAVITFDDGFSDFYANAFPILDSMGFTATVFLPTAFISKSGAGLEGHDHLSWGQAKMLVKKGMDFGSHTVDHPVLKDLSCEEITYQLTESKKNIEDRLETSCESFAYPFAFPEEMQSLVSLICGIISQTGYTTGVSTRIGSTCREDNAFYRKRLPINEYDDPALFAAKLQGAYDWLYWPQFTVKKIKKLLKNDSNSKEAL
jgi:peptidoglycan/xylan/chitin deacetylase (PgdA/CDA1 family)